MPSKREAQGRRSERGGEAAREKRGGRKNGQQNTSSSDKRGFLLEHCFSDSNGPPKTVRAFETYPKEKLRGALGPKGNPHRKKDRKKN